ncbi:uncharacterized protein BBA_09053 [Beauveria bassiana ARSEF 2860]|uniref:UDP-glucose/GDP-mannose dehydrogenase N-terminal domain-containing protein n=1 Tax=Beauveria bassiana (strain ARSEF 2860) TaxID=655819 RepID=J4VTZ1_BEAB2|nr:uncharacterized protein BBA_09053 [Beauveria bassiana ARSEF 2860]EJP62005.1 hypothetical protein BBA_09053 [Beauveria bassiana ARSEF 2860]
MQASSRGFMLRPRTPSPGDSVTFLTVISVSSSLHRSFLFADSAAFLETALARVMAEDANASNVPFIDCILIPDEECGRLDDWVSGLISYSQDPTTTVTQQSSSVEKGTTPLGIWGGGLIGLSTAAHFTRKGVSPIIIDINGNQVSRINKAQFPPNFESWIGFSIEPYIKTGLIRATTDVSQLSLESVKTHFVAVPTERNGEPDLGAIEVVLPQIRELTPDLYIIESTFVHGQTEPLARKQGGHPFNSINFVSRLSCVDGLLSMSPMDLNHLEPKLS